MPVTTTLEDVIIGETTYYFDSFSWLIVLSQLIMEKTDDTFVLVIAL